MSRTFSITLTAEERFAILVGMGWLWKTVENSPEAIRQPIDALIDKLSNTPGVEPGHVIAQPSTQTMASGAGAARAILSPPAPTDHFARDRKGNIPSSAPKGAELQNHKLVGFTKTTTFLKVVLENKGTANCFDSQLWPMIEKHDGRELGLWLLKSADGKFLNIVGVRA